MYEVSVLPGGLQVATVCMPAMRSVSLGIFIGSGSRHETAEESGVSHFIEHMLFKGTERRNVRQIALDVEGNGGSLNAYTSEDSVCYEAKGPAELLPLMADVLSDMVLRPSFPVEELEREREVVLEEITMYRENPGDYVQELAARALWGDHPLGRPITGVEETLEKMDSDFLRAFHRRAYRSPRQILVVAGPHSHREMLELAAGLYDGVVLGEEPPSSPPYEAGAWPAPGRLSDRRELEQSHFVLGYRTPGGRDERRHALRLLSILMGESMSSRLFQEVREKRGLAYSIYSDLSLFDECGSFSVYAGVDADKKEEALATIRGEVDRLLREGCSPEELEQAKRYALGQMRVALDTTGGQLSWVGDSLLQHGRIIPPDEAEATLSAVTVAQVCEAASLVFAGQAEALADVGV